MTLYRIHFTASGNLKLEEKAGSSPEDAWFKVYVTWAYSTLGDRRPYPRPDKLKFVRAEVVEVYPEHPPVDGSAHEAECDALRATIRFVDGKEIL